MPSQNLSTIIVTGGAGYIGSHTIIELLTKTNYNVISIDNFSNSTAKSYQRIKEITNKSFESLDFDLCNENQLVTQLSKIKNIIGIIHFAAYKSVPESVTNPLLYYINNLNSLNNLLKFAQEQKIENFIFSSSCSVYGNAENLPVTEETPLKKAESSYGHTKQIGEDIINFVCKANPNFNAVLLRYFNPVGAHPSGKIGEFPLNRPNNLVPIITQTAVGKNSLTVFGNDFDTRDGSCIRDYIHVSDIADAHVKALNYLIERKNKNNVSLFNLGTGNGVSVLEAIKSFEKVSGKKLNYTIGPRREGDVVAIYANNNLAKKELNWNPEFSLDDMMLSAWKWQLNLEAE
ncbi:MAG: UDP-glucose 4-epimerase GalE [Bacteroidota bacterium]|nr:UDP-glucose 4-epimerase GalE [Bacteroidota bacterium]MDP3144488.1 UDP-glucose 4-epimerase GalE [Bacteroidota bacterium]